MKVKFAIIGGGIAGLCAAIRLTELGEKPLLIEGGTYPTHKICGEFLSPECIGYLKKWGISPIPITKTILRTSKQQLNFPFAEIAGGLSHFELDPSLANYALEKGTNIQTNSKVQTIHPKQHPSERHFIGLVNGEWIEVENLIIATGRYPSQFENKPVMKYIGFKAHFEGIPLNENTLEMFSLSGAYLGISPIENQQFNVACLADLKMIGKENPKEYFQHIIDQNDRLKLLLGQGKNLFSEWMMAELPEFQMKQTPEWLDAYFIGDATLTIPPACGNGLSLAILGGRLAAEYAIQEMDKEFKKTWLKSCRSQFFWATLLHKWMLNLHTSDALVTLGNTFPWMSRAMFKLTRQRECIPNELR
ncbi:MAG: FAD-dependent oxidoreductase [Parachlamydiaceae bacterium]|nr:FAD-dependent oxidoreductase [Parachlamydiaceae bacterium]